MKTFEYVKFVKMCVEKSGKKFNLKGPVSGLRQFLTTEIPLKRMILFHFKRSLRS